ncbi:aminopyrimidine aminohydrolase [Frondihabitans sucicola]|uniref:Aminopyrimidine aminohydrolase n=1 Tax=Frondihabitans sucicola TaxID=1268041 RepID=A0ABM8GR04_9MICO|nr:TenA family protein [Frondihabitans sucicola]BDZ50716.1 aminopyrimidine aminohydrolase [Frondihabitans sucicola]
MSTTVTTGGITADLWAATSTIRAAIDDLPFLRELEAGTLDPALFRGYLAQDALYLEGYARVLTAAATLAPTADDSRFWARQALGTLEVERRLHQWHRESHSQDHEVVALRAPDASPTCTAYTSYLLSLVAVGSYAELVAGILPCFWVYDDVGSRLLARVGVTSGHPFGDWIDTYGDAAFSAATRDAREVVDRAGRAAGADGRTRMLTAFAAAVRYEWMFWDAAWRDERWPI